MANKIKNTTIVGSILTALLASACCLGPIVFAVLGLSGAGLILKFERYRPLFIIVAVILLGFAGYFTYRRKPIEVCASDTYCAKPHADRINKVVFWVAAVIVVFTIFIPIILDWIA